MASYKPTLFIINRKYNTSIMEMTNYLKFERLSESATVPKRSNEYDAGYDLYSPERHVIPPMTSSGYLVKTNIAVEFPKCPMGMNIFGKVHPRSGLSLKKSIGIGGGVIDRGYTGDVGVVIFNHGDTDFVVEKGDRIAQLVLHLIMSVPTIEITGISGHTTSRGNDGFGSTGTTG